MAILVNRMMKPVLAWIAGFSRRTLWAVGSMLAGSIAGVASAVFALNSLGLSAGNTPNGWQEWNLAEHSATLPYALGHFLAAGQLPPAKSSRQFVRRVDDAGKGLAGDCATNIAGAMPVARWWTLSAAAGDGTAGQERGVLSAGQALLEANGQLRAVIATEPQPANWLAPPSGGSYMLVLTLHEPASAITAAALPGVTRSAC